MYARKDDLMRTEEDLMAALGELERSAPDPGPVWHMIQAATRTGRSRGRRRIKPRALRAIVTTAVCAGSAVALTLTLLAGGTAHQRGTTVAGHAARPAGAKAVLHTARQVLLLAAAHVPLAPTSGSYWRLKAVEGAVEPAGTKAHPYDIVWNGGPVTVWFSKHPGKLNWQLANNSSHNQAVPLAPADWAAWRASGSPSAWYRKINPGAWDRLGPAAGGQSYTWQVSDGVLGYTEGNLPGLSAAEFARLPASVTGLRRYLLNVTKSLRIPRLNPAEADQFVWAEALNLLIDPVSGQVRASAFRVMATLPGVTSLGLIRDPFGRQGYGLRMSGFNLVGVHSEITAVIDPATGTLLDTSHHDNGTPTDWGDQVCHGPGVPSSLTKVQFIVPWMQQRHFSDAAMSKWAHKYCRFVVSYYGRPYSGWLDNYTAFYATGWVNALPHVPPATKANEGSVFFSAG